MKAKKKECKDLSPWIKSVKNHMWWSAMTCDGNSQLLKEKWVSILYHTADKHDWDLSVLYSCCAHEPISPRAHCKTKWLIVGSLAHEALKRSAREDTLKRFGPSNEDHPCLGSVPFTLQQIRTQVATFWIPGNGSTHTANCFRPQFGHWSISSRGFEWEEMIPLCLS